MAVQLLLPEGPRDERQVVAAGPPFTNHELDQAPKHEAFAMTLADRQETQLARPAAGREVRVHVPELLVERKRPLPADGDHADDGVAGLPR